MDYPFRMYGETVEIYRYQITYTEGEEPEAQQVTQGFPTLEEAQAEGDRHGVTPEPLDTTTYEWMDGLTFPTRNDAMAVYDLGEAGYKAQVAAQEEEAHRLENAVDQLQKQVDAVAPMYSGTGYIPSTMESMLALSQFALVQVSDEETKLKVSGLYPDWAAGNHTVGEIYNTHQGGELDESWEQTWEVHQAYNNAEHPDIKPGDPSWFTFNRPLHGKSPETARPWVKPQHGTTDTYKVGEYMIWTDGDIYTPTRETNFSPEEYAPDWTNWSQQQGGGTVEPDKPEPAPEDGSQENPITAARGMTYTYGLYYLDPEDSKTYLCKRTGEADGGMVELQYLPHELVGQYFEEVVG